MKTYKNRLFFVLVLVVIVMLACSLPGGTQVDSTEPPQATSTEVQLVVEPTPTEDVHIPPDMTGTATETDTDPPTSSPNAGQISYIFGSNLWRYLVDSGEIIQVATTASEEDLYTVYGGAQFSPDGRFIAYRFANGSWIKDLITGETTNISAYGEFFSWNIENGYFFTIQNRMECPAIDDLEDQVLLSFDIIRLNLNDLEDAQLIVNIGGGLRFLETLSSNGEWASIMDCACYSECGPSYLWHLPTSSRIAPPAGLDVGSFDFSADSQKMSMWPRQMFGYFDGALYSANTNFSNLVELYALPNSAPLNAYWSPDGEWIATTIVYFLDDEYTETNRCVRIIKPDGSQEIEAACGHAEMLAWSPDSQQLLIMIKEGGVDRFFSYNLESYSTTLLPIVLDPFTNSFIDWGRLP